MENNKTFYIVIAGIIAGASLWTSSLPDGLESVAGKLGFLAHGANNSALFTNYSAPGLGANPMSTIISGLIGISLCAGIVGLYSFARSASLKKR